MTRNFMKRLVSIAAGGALALTFACGEISENDFGQTLTFDGFFFEQPCSTGLVGLLASTSPAAEGEDPNCTLATHCKVAVQVTNHATGVPIPTTGGQGASGNPVPSTTGLRILPRNIHIEYLLPVGELPARDFVQSGNVDPGASDCREFYILNPEDSVAMSQDPLSFPPTPFYMTARVTWQGVTAGGQDIRSVGDIYIQVL